MDKEADALRVMEDLLRYGNSTTPHENRRHTICGFVRYDQAPHTSVVLPTEPRELRITWHGDNHLRPEEVGRQVFETLCQHQMGASYDHYNKTLSLTLVPATYAALDKLDAELQPLRDAAPTRTIDTPAPPTHGKITPGSDNERAK